MAKIKIKSIEPYESVDYVSLNERDLNSRHGAQFFRNVKQLQVGYGSSVFRVDRDGMWAGAETFATAPWKVDWDGNMTANSVTLSGYIAVGGAASDVNSGATTVSGGKITANSITASKINVSQLSAISADIGTVNAGTINGITITGGTIRTSSSGQRVQMLDSTNTLQILDSSGVVRAESFANGWEFNNTVGSASGRIFVESTFQNLQIQAVSADLFLTSISDITFAPGNGSIKAFFDTNGLNMNDNIDMQGNDIIDIGEMRWGGESSNPSTDGELKYYVSGGTEGLRMQFGGSDFQFDATAV